MLVVAAQGLILAVRHFCAQGEGAQAHQKVKTSPGIPGYATVATVQYLDYVIDASGLCLSALRGLK